MIGLIRILYNSLYPLVILVMVPALIWKMLRRGKYRHKFGQRFGIYSGAVRGRIAGRRWTMVHAVSVGEVLIALKLIKRLRARDPARAFVLSTTTTTGFNLAREHQAGWLEPIYHPLDFYPFTNSALNLIRPEALILIEAEVWPNLVCEARNRGIPAVLANARLSPRSERRFRAFRFLTGPVFNQLTTICVQDPEDVQRWRSLGVDERKIAVTGSIKFDDADAGNAVIPDFRPLLDSLRIPHGTKILLGGSTHPGEERLLGGVLSDLRRVHPGTMLICVPRHVERAKEICGELEALGLRVGLRSRIASPDPPGDAPDVLVVDTTGELRGWYALATVVFVGKSLLARGGQNPAEPLNVGRPVLFGPNMQNFDLLAARLVRENGAGLVVDAADLTAQAARLLDHPEEAMAQVANGRRVIASHRGATARTCDRLPPPADAPGP